MRVAFSLNACNPTENQLSSVITNDVRHVWSRTTIDLLDIPDASQY